MPQPVITITPLPPTQGQDAEVSFSGSLPKTLDVEWTPKGAGPPTITVGVGGKVILLIPANAESLKITDPCGEADAEATIVAPS